MFLVYLGNCAALSFLQNIQDMIQNEEDLSNLTADVASLSRLEELPASMSENVLDFQDADGDDLESLIDVFFTSVFSILPILLPKRLLILRADLWNIGYFQPIICGRLTQVLDREDPASDEWLCSSPVSRACVRCASSL